MNRVFKLRGRIANNPRGATVRLEEVDGGRVLFSVRPYRSREKYILPLEVVADIVCWKVAAIDAANKRRSA